ncbi:MAG: hypothetical protein KAW12_02625 [Candidatus Aminicenantes bacterium]|nr:hypothetical protein [Candidatus Aminicenantes bacterium]
MLTVLKYGVIISFVISMVSLAILVIKTFYFGKRTASAPHEDDPEDGEKRKTGFFGNLSPGFNITKLYAEPKGDVKKGIAYAFGKGMMPWEKESAGNHLPSYLCGISYHAGIFLSLLYLFAVIFSIKIPDLIILIFQVFCLAGFVSGVCLLGKRVLAPYMREISCPDDLAANIIVDVFLISAFLHTFMPGLAPYFFLIAILMFLYIPSGKIRHCFFFFYVRILFGIFYGRRGVFPSKPFQDNGGRQGMAEGEK